MGRQAFGLSRAAASALGAAVRGEAVVSTPEQVAARRAECDACPHFVAETERCLACGCFIAAKIRLSTERCPVGRWA